jgi:AraC-like DNA-binding protein
LLFSFLIIIFTSENKIVRSSKSKLPQTETLISYLQTMILLAPALCSLVCVAFLAMLLSKPGNPRERWLRLFTVVLFLTVSALWLWLAWTERGEIPLPGKPQADGVANHSALAWLIIAGTILSCGEVWLTWRLTLRRYIDTGKLTSNAPSPQKDHIDWGELSQKNIEQYFKISRPWLDPQFQLPDLANALGVNRSDLSSFINRTFEVNFKRYVNSWRLAEFERLMSLPSNELKNPYKVAKMAGFTDFRHFRRVEEQEREQEHETAAITT